MPGPKEPTLKYGVTCEKILFEKDNVISLIRIVDKFILTLAGPQLPESLPPGQMALNIAMCWVGGLGTHEAALNIIRPDGTVHQSNQTWPFTLDSLNSGHTIAATEVIEISGAGTYWIEFVLNGSSRNRIPFQIIYQRRQMRNPKA